MRDCAVPEMAYPMFFSQSVDSTLASSTNCSTAARTFDRRRGTSRSWDRPVQRGERQDEIPPPGHEQIAILDTARDKLLEQDATVRRIRGGTIAIVGVCGSSLVEVNRDQERADLLRERGDVDHFKRDRIERHDGAVEFAPGELIDSQVARSRIRSLESNPPIVTTIGIVARGGSGRGIHIDAPNVNPRDRRAHVTLRASARVVRPRRRAAAMGVA